MGEEQKIDPRHSGVRTFLRIVGPCLVVVAIYCLYRGISIFGRDEKRMEEIPMWVFPGMGILFVGLVMCMFGYAGAAARYQAAEMSPVAKDTINYLGRETREGLKAVASSIAEGVVQSVKSGAGSPVGASEKIVVRCQKCGAENSVEAKYCNQCGAAMNRTRTCAACNAINDTDSRFCNKCGNPLA